VVYTTNGVCPANSTETLTVLTTDDAMFTISPTCDGGVPILLGTTGGIFSFDITPIDTASIEATTGVITGGSSSASYDILYTTSGVCPSSSIETFTTDDCTILIIPTAFTPDNDGDNDRWEILELDFKYPNNIVRIFNRWGDLLFEHHASVFQPYNLNRWDGSYQGNIMPVGSYYFIIDLNDGSSESETGTVSIILNR
jgi:gliding motility-associated-like protein